MSWWRDTWMGLSVTALLGMTALSALLVIGFEMVGVPLWSLVLRDLGVNR